jgi:SAM-dependent methyltransferase
MSLIDEHPPRGRILDVGCGTGDLAIGLARAGHSVLGIDFAEAAIEVARSRSRALPAEQRSLVEFRVGDVLHLSGVVGAFECVADSGFYHLFDDDARRDFVRELAAALPRGGRFYLLGFAVSFPAPDVPREVTESEITALFSEDAGWALRVLRPGRFVARGFDDIPALVVCAERVEGPTFQP